MLTVPVFTRRRRINVFIKWIALLLSVCFAAIITSCAAEQTDRLAFRRFPMTLTGSLTALCGGESNVYGITLSLTGEGNGVLEFASPERIAGLCVELSPDGCVMRFGELEFPIAYGVAETARALISMFSISSNQMTSAETVSAGSVRLNSVIFTTSDGSVCVYYSEDGSPVRFNMTIPVSSGDYPLTGGTALTLDVDTITYPEG